MPTHNTIDSRLSHLDHLARHGHLSFDVTHMGDPDSYILSPCCGHGDVGYRAVYSRRPRIKAVRPDASLGSGSNPADAEGINTGLTGAMGKNQFETSFGDGWGGVKGGTGWDWTDAEGGDQASFFSYQQRNSLEGSWVLVVASNVDTVDQIGGVDDDNFTLDAQAKWWITSQSDVSTLAEEWGMLRGQGNIDGTTPLLGDFVTDTELFRQGGNVYNRDNLGVLGWKRAGSGPGLGTMGLYQNSLMDQGYNRGGYDHGKERKVILTPAEAARFGDSIDANYARLLGVPSLNFGATSKKRGHSNPKRRTFSGGSFSPSLRRWTSEPLSSLINNYGDTDVWLDTGGIQNIGFGEASGLPDLTAEEARQRVFWILYGERRFLGITKCTEYHQHGDGTAWGGLGVGDFNVNGIIPPDASARGGHRPGIILWGGDIDGVKATATVDSGSGEITAINVTDPGVGVVTHEYDEPLVAPRVGVTNPDYYPSFSATVNISTEYDAIKEAFPGLVKSKDQISAICSDGYQDPIAQTFLVNRSAYPDGVFVPSVDVCFQKKPNWGDNDPIYMDIRPTVNGFPHADKAILTVELYPEDVIVAPGEVLGDTPPPWAHPVDWDANMAIYKSRTFPHFSETGRVYTRFDFPYPLYLSSGTEYAIVLRSNDSNYRAYIADTEGGGLIGDSSIVNYEDSPLVSGTYAKQYGGAFFRSSNGRTWTENQTQDLMFRVNKCSFGGSDFAPATGTFTLGGERITSQNFDYDRIKLNLDSMMNPNPSTTGISASVQTQKKADSEGTLSTLDGISGNIFETGKTEDLSERMTYYKNKSSENSSFKMNFTLTSKSNHVSPVLDTRNSYVVPIQNQIDGGALPASAINFTSKGTSYQVNDTFTVSGGGSTEDATITVTEVEVGTGAIKKFTVSGGANFHTSEGIVVTDNGHGSGAKVEVLTEEGHSGGVSKMRYVTKPIKLAPGMSARAIKVFITGQQPYGSKIHVYYKALSEEDSETIGQKKWKLMNRTTPDDDYFDGIQSSFVGSGAISGTHEFVFDSDELISYTTNDGLTYDSFRTFAIKVVGHADNPAQPPVLKDLRAIAVY